MKDPQLPKHLTAVSHPRCHEALHPITLRITLRALPNTPLKDQGCRLRQRAYLPGERSAPPVTGTATLRAALAGRARSRCRSQGQLP